jgi:hypothetical protein
LEKADKEERRAREMAVTDVTLSCPYAPYHEDVYGRETYLQLFVKLGRS